MAYTPPLLAGVQAALGLDWTLTQVPLGGSGPGVFRAGRVLLASMTQQSAHQVDGGRIYARPASLKRCAAQCGNAGKLAHNAAPPHPLSPHPFLFAPPFASSLAAVGLQPVAGREPCLLLRRWGICLSSAGVEPRAPHPHTHLAVHLQGACASVGSRPTALHNGRWGQRRRAKRPWWPRLNRCGSTPLWLRLSSRGLRAGRTSVAICIVGWSWGWRGGKRGLGVCMRVCDCFGDRNSHACWVPSPHGASTLARSSVVVLRRIRRVQRLQAPFLACWTRQSSSGQLRGSWAMGAAALQALCPSAAPMCV
jgi:hypothetical protein